MSADYMAEKVYQTEYFSNAAAIWLRNDMLNMQIGEVKLIDTLTPSQKYCIEQSVYQYNLKEHIVKDKFGPLTRNSLTLPTQ